ncbi:MAG: DNA repair protein RecN [Micavibrio aeruginosavorus]|uniref:DNA repair protein RecN n=1 Tax=Micavibrio aeruginosavorus TaxID=349221 RepID=A0A7T5UGM7_9BACT|nr:MAG: DNA repair protein RecN [Micavibrio aeruginosavorus]
MLRTLHIRSVVLVDQLTVEFTSGFCALTGETGAGKSILLDSLGLALGGRSDSGLVRKGADQAQVTAAFDCPAVHPLRRFLQEQGFESDETIVLRRIVGADGRSRAFINDRPVSVGLLKQAGDLLVEIHGQFDTQGLLDPRTHRLLLDEYAGVDARKLEKLWDSWRHAVTALAEAQVALEKARADEEYLRHAVKELEDLAPESGEEEQLLMRRESLKHRGQVLEALQEAWNAIASDAGAEMAVGRASRTLGRILDKAGCDLSEAMAALDRAGDELQAAVADVQSAISRMENSALSMEEIEDRLYALRGMARKHHCKPDDLAQLADRLREEVALIDKQDDRLAALGHQVMEARKSYEAEARAISRKRKDAAVKLDKLVAQELPPLKLDKARFETRVDAVSEDAWGPAGMDQVQFLVATNPGSYPGPLNKIASGGEMSRFMLALKVVMTEVGAAPTLVFDEVDSGIGGGTAAAVGERLARLAAGRQILVVTHSPQVAARAGSHFIVMKQGQKDTKTTVLPLQAMNDRREEIARMISGAEITAEARAAAAKLLETGS